MIDCWTVKMMSQAQRLGRAVVAVSVLGFVAPPSEVLAGSARDYFNAPIDRRDVPAFAACRSDPLLVQGAQLTIYGMFRASDSASADFVRSARLARGRLIISKRVSTTPTLG